MTLPAPAEGRRAEILEAARVLFLRDGYARTPVSAIVKAAGVAQGTFYLYFASKQELLAELARAVFRDYASIVVRACALDAPADERLARIVVQMHEAVRENRDLETLLRNSESALATEQASLEGRARLARSISELVEACVAEGLLPGGSDAYVVSHFMVTLFNHALYESLVYEAPAPIEVTVAEGLRFAMRALGMPEARIERLADRLLGGAS